jgi:hypothetical protein
VPRELLDRLTVTDATLAEQIAIRRANVAELDRDIAGFMRDPDGTAVNMRSFATMKNSVAAKRVRAIRNKVQAEIDALQAEVDRRANRGDG